MRCTTWTDNDFIGHTVVSRQDRKDPRRETGAVLHVRPGDRDKRTGFRHLVEIGQKLDLVVIGMSVV